MARRKSNNTLYGRRPGQALCLLVTCLTLFVAVKVSDGGFANSIDKITKNLDVALRDLRDDMPVYENYTDREVYVSNKYFNPKGMAGLYNLTNKFMDFVTEPAEFLMKDLIVFDANANPQLNREITLLEILKHYWLLLTILLVTALITVFLPVCGFCFCCCRCCCGRCGARSRPADKRRDLCKKVVQGSLLIILGTALLFCVVCAFASNQQLEEGINELTGSLRISKRDTNTYLESTKKQAVLLLDHNYKSFVTVFTSTINKSGEHVTQQLSIWSNATAMTDLNRFVINIPEIKDSLETLKVDTNTLRASASQLNDAMRKVKRDLLTTLKNCPLIECENIKNNISNLQMQIDFNKLPDVTPTIDKIGQLDIENLQKAAKEGINQLYGIEREIKNRLNDTLGEAIVQVDKAGRQIQNVLRNVTRTVTDIQTQVNKTADPILDNMGVYIKRYQHYRYYGGLAVSCVLLLTTVCIAFGLTCGICGKRPDGYSDNCCNKGAGGQFLICGVMIMFIFGFIIGVITITTLCVGLTADRAVCYPVRHPEKSTVINVVDKFLSKAKLEVDVSVREILLKCYQNQSIYSTLNLKQVFNVDTLQDDFDISRYLDNMNQQLDGMNLKVTILSPTNEHILRNLSNFHLSINFEQFQDELRQNFTNLSLNDISKELEKLLEVMGDKEEYASVVSEVRLSIMHINTYEENLVVPMKERAEKVITIAQKLDEDLRMNSSSFPEAIEKLLSEIKDAQDKLSYDGTNMLKMAATSFGEILMNQIRSYIYRVGNVTKDELGQCGPMNLVINATLTATCDKIVLPWNGFWVTLLFSLALFIPTIIISVKLASLYQKYKQYGQYVETEYLYDAYADRDNIPLSSRGKRSAKNNKKKKGKKFEDRPQNMGGEVVTREYATGSHPPDARYSDMAPKHWEEFPNGGPPQYQRAPTEYERPPPYYYPGSGDQ